MKKDYIIRITSGDGRYVLELSPDAPCRLLAGGLTGFDCTGLDVSVRPYASRHGGYPEKRRFMERELGLYFEIDASPDETETIRRRIVSMMDPTKTCEIDAEIYGTHRKISAIPCGEALFVRETMYDRPEVSLEFIAPDVFFRAAEPVEVVFRDPVMLLTAPFSFFAGAGMTTGIFRTASTASLTNEGDADCGIVVEITADGGSIVNPGISCGSDGAFVRCPLTLADGDTLVIDTRDRQKSIYKNGGRWTAFDRHSRFFRLPPGKHTVSILCDEGGEYIRAKVSYVPLYFGI
ncbi:MAG: phage tail family protein [Clostridia bacterium]|nr:phage tail family protein [Clostridia bacterium]